MSAILLMIVSTVSPLRWDHMLAMLPPVDLDVSAVLHRDQPALDLRTDLRRPRIAESLDPKLTIVLLQLATIMVFFPLTQAVTLIPLGAELLMQFGGSVSASPFACCCRWWNAGSSLSPTATL